MNNENNHHEDPEEIIFDAEEASTLMRVRPPILTETRRPVITVRQANLPSVRGRKVPVGGSLSWYLKPDGVHYSRKLLAGIGLLCLLCMMGLLVLRALSRRFSAPAEDKVVSVEEAIGKSKRGRTSDPPPLSAGGPPMRSKSNQRASGGSLNPPFSAYDRVPVMQTDTSYQRGADAYQPSASQAKAGRRAIAVAALNGSPMPKSGPPSEEKTPSQSFASAWAASMAERLPTLEGDKLQVTGDKKEEDLPVTRHLSPVTAAPPARNTNILLTLLQPVTSGIAAPVQARVAVDVKDSKGAVIIPHGSIATIPFLAVEVHGRIPQDRQSPISVTLPDGREMSFRGLVRGRDGLPGVTGKLTKAKGGPGWFKRALGMGGRAASVGLSATGIGGIVSPSDVSGRAGVDTYGGIGSSQGREVHAPAGSSITITIGL